MAQLAVAQGLAPAVAHELGLQHEKAVSLKEVNLANDPSPGEQHLLDGPPTMKLVRLRLLLDNAQAPSCVLRVRISGVFYDPPPSTDDAAPVKLPDVQADEGVQAQVVAPPAAATELLGTAPRRGSERL